MWPPSPFSALPPIILVEASPKAISRRTSYLRVRLEFLRYPQIIPKLFNACEFGPPWCFTTTSSCSWIGHPVSGLCQATPSPSSDSVSLRLRASQHLTSLHNITRRSVLQKVRDRTSIVLSLLVNTGFQVLFHSPPGVLFTFPSRYYSLSVTTIVFSLGGWSPLLPTGFLVSCGTLGPARKLPSSSTGLLPSLVPLPKGFHSSSTCSFAAPQPQAAVAPWFGLFPFRSPLLRKSFLLSFPPGT